MSSATYILTVEEALRLPVDPLEEIVNGAIRKMPPAENAHTALIEALYRTLTKQLAEEKYRIRVTSYGLGIRTEPTLAVRNPDLTVFDEHEWAAAFSETKGRGYVWIAPKLIVECLSPSNRKGSIHQLLADYESARASEVWLINPRRRTLISYLLQDRELILHSSLSEGTVRATAVAAEVEPSLSLAGFRHGPSIINTRASPAN